MNNRWLYNAWRNNNDGAGYVFAKGDELVIRKPFYKLKNLIRSYNKDYDEFGAESVFALHLRRRSHGDMGEANVHPHSLAGGQAALLHNGVICNFTPPHDKKELSDTSWFCKTVLEDRPAEQLCSVEFGSKIKEMVGGYNKIVIMTAKEYIILNKNKGQEDSDGFWCSNDSHEEKRLVICGSHSNTYCGASNYNRSTAMPGVATHSLPVAPISNPCEVFVDGQLVDEPGDYLDYGTMKFRRRGHNKHCLPPQHFRSVGANPQWAGASSNAAQPADLDVLPESEWQEHDRKERLKQLKNVYDYHASKGEHHVCDKLIDEMAQLSKEKTPIILTQDGSGFGE